MSTISRKYDVSYKYEKLISWLLRTNTIKEASKMSGASQKTIYRLMKDPEFKDRLRRVREDLLTQVTDKLALASDRGGG